MSTYLLIPGSYHGGWCWSRVGRRLREAGHDVYTPTLTGLGERAHLFHDGIGLETHINDIVQVMYYEDLHDVGTIRALLHLAHYRRGAHSTGWSARRISTAANRATRRTSNIAPGRRPREAGRGGDLGQSEPRPLVAEAREDVKAARQRFDEVRAFSTSGHLRSTLPQTTRGQTAAVRHRSLTNLEHSGPILTSSC